jgi:hypothetical protein
MASAAVEPSLHVADSIGEWTGARQYVRSVAGGKTPKKTLARSCFVRDIVSDNRSGA